MNPGDTCTPIYQLPYPTGSSDPCLVGSTLCAFAEAVESQLDVFDSVIARTATTVPMVKVVATVPILLVNPGADFNAQFDTVEVDTDNMFSSADTENIVFNHDGIYLFQANIFTTTTGGGNVTSLSPNITLPTFSFGPGNSYVTGLGIFVSCIGQYPATTTDTVFLRINSNIQSTDTITITRMEMMATWLGDLA